MDYSIILSTKYQGFEWTLNGDSYEGLTWVSNTAKPTEQELKDLWPEVQAELVAKAQAKIDAKASAIAKLEALGLTIQEVEVAFGLSE
jgi:hypothetical protein